MAQEMALKISRISRTILLTTVASATSLTISVLRSSSPAPAAGGAPADCASANRGVSKQPSHYIRGLRPAEPPCAHTARYLYGAGDFKTRVRAAGTAQSGERSTHHIRGQPSDKMALRADAQIH